MPNYETNSEMMDLFIPVIKADFTLLERYSQVAPESWLEFEKKEGKQQTNPFVLPISISFFGGTFVLCMSVAMAMSNTRARSLGKTLLCRRRTGSGGERSRARTSLCECLKDRTSSTWREMRNSCRSS